MMRLRMVSWNALLLAAALVACEAPGSVEPPRAPVPGHASRSASAVHGTGTYSFDAVFFWDCVGEEIHNVFSVSYSYTMVELPDGRSMYREIWLNQMGAGTITGLTSGNVWRRDIHASPYFVRSGGPTEAEAYVYNGRFVSETAPDIYLHEAFHVSTNANGDVVVDNFTSSCTMR